MCGLSGLPFLVSWLLPSGMGTGEILLWDEDGTRVSVTQLTVSRDTVEKGGDFGKMVSTFPTK